MAVVAITDSTLGTGVEEEMLEADRHTVRRLGCDTEADLIAAACGADALIVQWAPITAAVLDALPTVRFVSRLGIGVDMVDLEAASARGVAVANTPDYCVDEVVAHSLAFILGATRGIVQHDRALRAGAWESVASYPTANRPAHQTVAVIGLGRIGGRVASQLVGLGYTVLGVDPIEAPPPGVGSASLAEALASADIVTLHAPLTTATRHLIDATALATMQPSAILVNTCRGPLIDTEALLAALDARTIGGAMLDVFEREPLEPTSRLLASDRVVVSAHAAWYSPAALVDLPRRAAAQTVDFLAGRPVPTIVNPEYRSAIGGKKEEGTWTTR